MLPEGGAPLGSQSLMADRKNLWMKKRHELRSASRLQKEYI
jgi:hypothetical protein